MAHSGDQALVGETKTGRGVLRRFRESLPDPLVFPDDLVEDGSKDQACETGWNTSLLGKGCHTIEELRLINKVCRQKIAKKKAR